MLQVNGDFAGARRAFAQLLQDTEDGPELREARFRLAQCYLEDDLYDEAAAALIAFLDSHPRDERQGRALFSLGAAQMAVGNWDGSISAYQRYLEVDGLLLTDVVQMRIGDAQRKAGRPDAAVAAYEAALDAAPDPATARQVHRALAEVQFLRGDYDAALAQYRALRGLASTAPERAEAELRQSEVQRASGQVEAAEQHLRAAMAFAPKTEYAYEALKGLLAMGAAVSDYDRGVIGFHNGAYWASYDALQRHIASGSVSKLAEAHHYIALVYTELGLHELAEAEWDRLILQFPDSPLVGDAWFGQAEGLRASGKLEEARWLLRRFAQEHPSHPRAAEALRQAAKWAEGAGDVAAAADEYASLQRQYPSSEQAGPALFAAALGHYRLGQYTEAARFWGQLVEEYPAYRPESALLWLGKTYLASGKSSEAVTAWQVLLDTAPASYSAGRAMALADAGGIELTVVQQMMAAATGAAGKEAVDEWLRGWVAGGAADLAMLPAEVVDDQAYQRGVALLALGLEAQGLAALETIRNRWRDDAMVMYALALRFRELGAYRLSILCANRLLDLSPSERRGEAPQLIRELAYPTYFADLVGAEAEARGLDPLLVYAMIRQESLFEAGARSYAAAQGLMQVIPPTGEWVAESIGWPDFEAELLYRPYVNVKFGVAYFAFALAYAGDNIFTALAGYNAGPGAARLWRIQAGSDDDLFVETMTIAQPQHYVRGVMEHYAEYQRLYAGG